MKNYNNIDEFIEEVVKRVKMNIVNVNDINIEAFKTFLLDNIMFECIGSGKLETKVYGNVGKVDSKLMSSLLASSIKSCDKMAKDEVISETILSLSRDTLLDAKRRVLSNETKYLDGNEFGKYIAMTYAKIDSNKEIIDPAYLIRIGTCVQDRKNGYNESKSELNDYYINMAYDAWKKEKMKYVVNNQMDTPYFKIIYSLFNARKQEHYPLVTRKALEHVASFIYKVDNDLDVTLADLNNMYRYNKASKLLGKDVINEYSDEIKNIKLEYIERHKGMEKVKKLVQ